MLKRILAASLAAIVLAAFCSPGMAGAAPPGSGEAGLNTGSASDAGAPIYPGGKPINGGLQKTTLYSKVIGTSVTFSTPASFEKVYSFYRHALPSKAVTTETDDDPTNRIGTFTYTKGDGSQIDIEIQSYPGHTNYTITDTYKK
jgi:hypothetical protein